MPEKLVNWIVKGITSHKIGIIAFTVIAVLLFILYIFFTS